MRKDNQLLTNSFNQNQKAYRWYDNMFNIMKRKVKSSKALRSGLLRIKMALLPKILQTNNK